MHNRLKHGVAFWTVAFLKCFCAWLPLKHSAVLPLVTSCTLCNLRPGDWARNGSDRCANNVYGCVLAGYAGEVSHVPTHNLRVAEGSESFARDAVSSLQSQRLRRRRHQSKAEVPACRGACGASYHSSLALCELAENDMPFHRCCFLVCLFFPPLFVDAASRLGSKQPHLKPTLSPTPKSGCWFDAVAFKHRLLAAKPKTQPKLKP